MDIGIDLAVGRDMAVYLPVVECGDEWALNCDDGAALEGGGPKIVGNVRERTVQAW